MPMPETSASAQVLPERGSDRSDGDGHVRGAAGAPPEKSDHKNRYHENQEWHVCLHQPPKPSRCFDHFRVQDESCDPLPSHQAD